MHFLIKDRFKFIAFLSPNMATFELTGIRANETSGRNLVTQTRNSLASDTCLHGWIGSTVVEFDMSR